MRYTNKYSRALPLLAILTLSGSLILGSSTAQAARLVTVGDSITHGVVNQCGYRAVVAAELLSRNSCDITFTGTNWKPSGVPPDTLPPAKCALGEFAHESQSGWAVDDFLPPTQFQLASNWVKLASADFMLMHLGTNDYYNGDSVATVQAELDALITHVFVERPDTKILLANVIPLSATDPTSIQYGNDLAAAIEALVVDRAGNGDAVYLVDVHTGFDVATMTFDTVHPNNLGEQFLADRFVAVLDSLNVCSTPSIRITQPEEGSTLSGSSTMVEWTAEGVVADAFRVTAGSRGAYRAVLEPAIEDNPPPPGYVQPGIADFDPGTVLPASATSTTVSGLPTDGRRAFITLHYRENGIWKLSPLSVKTHKVEVNLVSSCLAGNGRVDLNIVNTQTATSTYRLELQGLSARQTNVLFEDWGRMPITGRRPGTYSTVVKRDGVTILSENIEINCAAPVPPVSVPEVTVKSSCRNNNGYILFQMVNPSNTTRPYVIVFEGVSNRSTSAAPYGQAVRATTGRPDGSYNYLVRTGSTVLDSGQTLVDCD